MYLGSSCQGVVSCGLYLILLSQLWSIFAEGDNCSCQQYRCDPCPSSGACTKLNVALSKSASASRLYSSPQFKEVSGPPCLAVNGDTSTIFRPINTYPNNSACVHTDTSDYYPYWEVDLGQQYIISTITVYGREEAWNTLRNAIVTVDNQPCYTFAPDYIKPFITQITCSSSLTGRKVRIGKVYDNDKPYFAVCQVQVWVCKSGYYDPNCTNSCGNCYGGTCDPSSGECPQGCSAGYQPPYCKHLCSTGSYGVNCSNKCGNCAEGSTCNEASGECFSGCQPGYQGLYCNVFCSIGFYGAYCRYTCGSCRENTSCNAVSGECPQGCKPGYQGTNCKQSCSAGSYGEGCNERCGNCAGNSPCNVCDGRCETGCAAGFQPPTCKACLQWDNTDRGCASCAGSVAGAVIGSCAVCTLVFVLAILLMRYRHRHEQDKRPSAACFTAQVTTVQNQDPAGASSFETESSSDFDSSTWSSSYYNPLAASRELAYACTTLVVNRAGDVRSPPYVNTT